MLHRWMMRQQERCSGSFTFPGWTSLLGSAGPGGGLALDEILLDAQRCFLVSKTWALAAEIGPESFSEGEILNKRIVTGLTADLRTGLLFSNI